MNELKELSFGQVIFGISELNNVIEYQYISQCPLTDLSLVVNVMTESYSLTDGENFYITEEEALKAAIEKTQKELRFENKRLSGHLKYLQNKLARLTK